MPEVFAQSVKASGPRIHLMDEVRGFAVLCMIVYHGLYLFADIFHWSAFVPILRFFYPAEPFFAAAFIFISGISSQLSHSNLARGLKLAAVALVVTAATYLVVPDSVIIFGVLHMLAFCMIFFGLTASLLQKIPFWPGFLSCLILFLLTWGLSPHNPVPYVGIPPLLEWKIPDSWMQTDWLCFLGLHTETFVSGDYFPIFPWMFVFLGGTFVGRFAKAGKFPSFTYKRRIPFFSLVGRHALLLYVLHQPVLFGVCLLIQWLL